MPQVNLGIRAICIICMLFAQVGRIIFILETGLYMDTRQQEIDHWLNQISHIPRGELHPLTGDASFRRYFRLKSPSDSFIVMDAPPEKERCGPFLAVAQGFQAAKIPVPQILAHDLDKGFMVLSDFGDDLLLNALTTETAPHLYQTAFEILVDIQSCQVFPEWQLPSFSAEFMQMELERFPEWYLQGYCKKTLSSAQADQLQQLFDKIISVAKEQPQVCIHRDYHSRNLMVMGGKQLGVLDFQDAMQGPFTYDLVSLLRDCYIDWSTQQVYDWVLQFKALLTQQGRFMDVSDAEFIRWFDWMGVQRHLKCIGIFARLALRDNKPSYLHYIPRIHTYLRDVTGRYPELELLQSFL